MQYKHLLVSLVGILFLCNITLIAQPVKTTKPIVKFKPPVVTTSLLKYSGKAASCFAEEGVQLIKFPIKVVDAKNTTYTIVSYGFIYNRIVVTEDEATGKTSLVNEVVGRRFTAEENPLPAVWQTNIQETLKKGESILFYDVYVRDNKNRLFVAPDLKITIK